MSSYGTVEIMHNNHWRPLCDVNWGISESNVICRQLGYSTMLTQSRRNEHNRGNPFILPFIWSCTGNESNIAECMTSGRSNDCFVVGVACLNITSKFGVFVYLIQNSQAVKKGCGPQKGQSEKRCEIQGGGQEIAVMVD